MNMISRDERKKQKGFKKFVNSFKYPINGLKSACKCEQNLMLDIAIAIIVLILGVLLKINKYEWIILIITIGLVICFELINTSIETVVDLVTEKYHPLAKMAKDISASSVLIFAFISVIVGLIIFLPKIINLL